MKFIDDPKDLIGKTIQAVSDEFLGCVATFTDGSWTAFDLDDDDDIWQCIPYPEAVRLGFMTQAEADAAQAQDDAEDAEIEAERVASERKHFFETAARLGFEVREASR